MLFQFFRPQIQREPPTISSTMHRANESGQMDIDAYMRLEASGDLSRSSANPVIMVKPVQGRAAKEACGGSDA
jgi:hypothetical protein